MAKSGSITTYQHIILGGGIGSSYLPNDGPTYNLDLTKTTFEWAIASQDLVNNKSTVNWTLRVENLNNYSMTTLRIDEFYIYDETDYPNQRLYYNGDFVDVLTNQVAYSGSFTFTHKNDGTFSIPLSFSAAMSATSASGGSYYSNYAIEDIALTLTLDSISRHALIYSAPDFTDEDSPVINYAVPSGITGYIYLSLDGNAETESTTLKAVTGAGDYTYTFTEAERKKLWAIQDQGLVSKRVRFFIKSTSSVDGITYREPSAWVNLSIINYMPTLNTEVWDTNTDVVNRLTGNKYILVRYASNAAYTTGAQAHKGATISSQSVKNSDVTKYGASGTFNKVTSNEFDFSVVDNYGRATQAPMVFEPSTGKFIEYIKLTCSAEVTEMTADGDVQVTLRGKFFSGDFGIKENRMRMHYDISKNNGDPTHVDKGYIYPTINGSDYEYLFTISGLEYLSVYELTVRVSDEIMVDGAEAHTVLASTPLFDWGRTDFNFNIPVHIEGDLTVSGTITSANGGSPTQSTGPTIVDQGTSGIWTYRLWSDGVAECWGTLSVTAAVSTSTNASWYSSGELSATNLSFPFTFTARPSVTVQTMPTGQSWCIVFPSNTTGSTTKTGSYQLNSMSSTTSRTHLLSYDVKGKWK